jgi:hypothetical protein
MLHPPVELDVLNIASVSKYRKKLINLLLVSKHASEAKNE